MIERNDYLQQLIKLKDNNLIKIITGIRRCGKTYLLFNIFTNYLLKNGVKNDHIIKIQFDKPDDKKYQNPDLLVEHINSLVKDNDKYYLLLDEVQLLNNFVFVLNNYLDKNFDVYVTGSNAKFLSSYIATEFAGHGIQIRVLPLTFKEYYEYEKNYSKDELFNLYIYYGGLPQILLFKDNETKVDYLKNLFDEVYLRDIIIRNKIRNKIEINDFLKFIASNIGNLTSLENLKNNFKSKYKDSKITNKSLERYIKYFIDSFLINEVQKYDIKTKKYVASSKKYYFTDLGLRNAWLNFNQIEFPHLLENVIYNELIYRKFNVSVGNIKTIEQSINKNLEIDFVCTKFNQKYYIQVALNVDDQEKYEQQLKPLFKTGDEFPKILIVKDNVISHVNEKGVKIISLFNFLLDQNSI